MPVNHFAISSILGSEIVGAFKAGHGQIVQIISAQVLPGGDVLKLEWNEGFMLLFEQAVFATPLRMLPDLLTKMLAHALCRSSRR